MLSLSSRLKTALNSPNVTSFRLYQASFLADTYSTSTYYRAGDMCESNGTTYHALGSMNAPAPSPPNATYWEAQDNPLCFTDLNEDVEWSGDVYKAFPVKCGDFRQGADGKMDDVTISVANVGDDRLVQQILEDYEFIGQDVKIHQFFVDPITDIIIDEPLTSTFKIKGARATKGQVDFTLSMGFEFLLTTLPNRYVFAGNCRWRRFRDSNCKYTGIDTICRKTFEDCKKKNNLLNFGGFPAISNSRFYF